MLNGFPNTPGIIIPTDRPGAHRVGQACRAGLGPSSPSGLKSSCLGRSQKAAVLFGLPLQYTLKTLASPQCSSGQVHPWKILCILFWVKDFFLISWKRVKELFLMGMFVAGLNKEILLSDQRRLSNHWSQNNKFQPCFCYNIFFISPRKCLFTKTRLQTPSRNALSVAGWLALPR